MLREAFRLASGLGRNVAKCGHCDRLSDKIPRPQPELKTVSNALKDLIRVHVV